MESATYMLVEGAIEAALQGMRRERILLTGRERLHLTIFHFGRPGDPRPADNMSIEAEKKELTACASTIASFELPIRAIRLTPSGVLVLLFEISTEAEGVLQLRQLLRHKFPSAPATQTKILHLTLARLMDVPSVEQLERITSACSVATHALRTGTHHVKFMHLWHVIERALPIIGDVHEIALCR